jgi:hypothetical protein
MSGTSVKVVTDSISPAGRRLLTFELRFPRFILPQFNTYGSIAKNARSSRAVPTEKLIAEVERDPVWPYEWGQNRKGMVAGPALGAAEILEAGVAWDDAVRAAVAQARKLAGLGVHKQVVNRLLEPFMWAHVVATATDNAWTHYFAQRCADDAQPEHRELARAMARAYRDSTPYRMEAGWWHLPYVTAEELAELCNARTKGSPNVVDHVRRLLAVSVVRCRRVSLAPFDGRTETTEAYMAKHDETVAKGHWSCTEHQGRALHNPNTRSGRMTGWAEYRQDLGKSVHTEFDFTTV